MIFHRSDILKCFKVGQLIFRPIAVGGALGQVNVQKNTTSEHPLKCFVRTVVSDPNQQIFEPTLTFGGRGIITWLTNDDGTPFTESQLPENWFALRIRRECKSDVLNASVLTSDEAGLEYYSKWREEMSRVFDAYDAVCGMPFELSPSSMRMWFKPVYNEEMILTSFDAKLIQHVS